MIVQKTNCYYNTPEIRMKSFLREICAGIEEEGVLYEIHSRDADMDELAFEAAKIHAWFRNWYCRAQDCHADGKASQRKNVFELNDPRFWQCRNLGANSARAVKKCRLRLFTGKTGRCRYEHLYKKR